jgi:hypothetical protein
MSTILRPAFLVATPLALAVLLAFHPGGDGSDIYGTVHDQVTPWLAVHLGMAPLLGLLAIAVWVLLGGVEGRAATVSRVALVPFLVFYTAFEATAGVATGLLADYANGLPVADRAPVAGAIQSLNESVAVQWVFPTAGSLGWLAATIAAAVALHGAGAGRAATVLLALSGIFVVHPPPFGPAALVCFAAAAALLERARLRAAQRSDPALDRLGMAPTPT